MYKIYLKTPCIEETDNTAICILDTNEKKDETNEKKFQCFYCSKVTKSERAFLNHEKFEHLPCVCPICMQEKRFRL